MGKSQRQLEFDLHALGQLPDLLAGVQPEDLQVVGKGSVVPVRVKASGQGRNLRQGFPGVKGRPAGGVADLPTDILSRRVLPQNADDAGVSMDKPQDRFHGRGLSRAVPAKKAHNMPLFQRKAYILQGKLRVSLAKSGNLQNMLHIHPSLWFYFRVRFRKSPPRKANISTEKMLTPVAFCTGGGYNRGHVKGGPLCWLRICCICASETA